MTIGAPHVFAAIADPTRRTLLDLLLPEERTVSDLVTQFDMSQQAVSQHLQVLKDAGLMTEQRVGTRRMYSIRPEGVDQVREFMEELWPDRLARLKRLAETKAKRVRGG